MIRNTIKAGMKRSVMTGFPIDDRLVHPVISLRSISAFIFFLLDDCPNFS